MPYPYSWKPDRVVPINASQVSVWNSSGASAALSTPITVSNGTLSFALTNAGKYRISVRNGSEIQTGTFTVDTTGTDTDTPEYTTYSSYDSSTDLPTATPPPNTNPVVRVLDIANPTTPGGAALNTTFVRFVDLAGNPISARHVTIKVDTSTWEISDIVAEA
jgi:uncharacterized protein with beta-barrel porin domain